MGRYSVCLTMWGLICLAATADEQAADPDLRHAINAVHNKFSVTRVFAPDQRFDAFRELELVDEQAHTIRELIADRNRARQSDLAEAETVSGADAAKRFVQEVARREKEREQDAVKVLRETVLDFQQEELGELIVRHLGLDALGSAFARPILNVTDEQAKRLLGMQTEMNSEFERIFHKYGSLESAKAKSELQSMSRMSLGICKILTPDQLKTYLVLRGKLKEGQPLDDFIKSLPASHRGEAEEAIRSQRDRVDNDLSSR